MAQRARGMMMKNLYEQMDECVDDFRVEATRVGASILAIDFLPTQVGLEARSVQVVLVQWSVPHALLRLHVLPN